MQDDRRGPSEAGSNSTNSSPPNADQPKGGAFDQQSAYPSKGGQQSRGSNPSSGPQAGQPGQASNSPGQQGSGAQLRQEGGFAAGQGFGSQRPAGGETLARITQGAHQAVDATAAKVAPAVDAVHDKVEAAKGAAQGVKDAAANAKDKVGAAKDEAAEWVGAARDAIVQNPFAAIVGAFLIGAAYASLKRR